MLTIYYTKGLPGSGKTTWAKEKMKELGVNSAIRVNKDDIRAMISPGLWTPRFEKFVVGRERDIAASALASGRHLIVDNTGFNDDHLKFYRDLAVKHKASFEVVTFPTTIEECIKNDLKRPNSVGEKVIREMHKKYLEVKVAPPAYDSSLKNAVICDLDGTLAILNGRNPYDASTCGNDAVNRVVEAAIVGIVRIFGARVFFASGRSDKYRPQTSYWLFHKNEAHDNDNSLLMRKEGDLRRDSIIKREIYEEHIQGKYNVVAIFDDRPQVIRECWQALGFSDRIFNVGTGEEF